MNVIHLLINDSVMNALGWSIIHILWQGTVLALISGLVLFVFRHKSPRLRYFILLTGLFLFVGLSVTNFTFQLENSKRSVRITEADYTGKIQTERTKQATIDQKSGKETIQKWFDTFKTDIDRYFPIMISLWIAGVILFTLKFVLSYFYTIKLKLIKKRCVSGNWQNRFDQIRRKLNLSKTVRYFESHRIKIPMVLGHFKPIILIPAEMLIGMLSS